MKVGSNVDNKHPCKRDEFLPTLAIIFTVARWFGIPTHGGKTAICRAILTILMLTAVVVTGIWKLIRLLTGVAINSAGGRGFIGRLSGTIFYVNALLSFALSWKLFSSWNTLSFYWVRVESIEGMYFPPDTKIRKRIISISVFVTICAIVEHILSMISATGFGFPPGEYFKRYILNSHGFLMQPHEYTLWLAIPIFVLSKIATILWNFQDLIIILISMGLTSRYHRLNVYVDYIVKAERRDKKVLKFGTEIYAQTQIWRRIREAYVRQASLVRRVDQNLGKLVLLSNFNNFYFICLQLYLGMDKGHKNLINNAYYFFSLAWLLFRACSVVLAAADVSIHSRRALPFLYRCPGSAFNVEIKRLKNQLTNDIVHLSGMGLFSLERQLLLEVAAAILKYELVLLQYDKN